MAAAVTAQATGSNHILEILSDVDDDYLSDRAAQVAETQAGITATREEATAS